MLIPVDDQEPNAMLGLRGVIMITTSFEGAILPKVGKLEVLSGRTADEANQILRPCGFELIMADRPIPKGWPKSIYRKFFHTFVINGKRQRRLIIHWREKLVARAWRRFCGFAFRPESIPGFIYRRKRRSRGIIEYVPIVFVECAKHGEIIAASKSWCISARRSKSSSADTRWSRGTVRS